MFRLMMIGLALLMGVNISYAANTAEEQQAIRDIDAKWVAAVATKNAGAVAGFYADDAALLAPDEPIAQGKAAIQAAWGRFLSLKDFKLTFAPTKIVVASGNDMAYEIGTYALSFDDKKGPVQDNGKYVVVWTNKDGRWLAAADIFNSNGSP